MAPKYKVDVTALIVGSLLSVVPAWAQPSTESSNRRTGIIFYTENDDWPPDTGTDKNYTNGFRLTIDRNSDTFKLHRWPLFRWVPAYEPCDQAAPGTTCISSAFHFGQQFYTPDDISIPDLIANGRPYAAWLYVGGSWRANSFERAVITDVYVGFTGDPSLGREVQTNWHKIVGATKPEGWDHQIGDRFGIVLAHSRHWVAHEEATRGHRWLEVTPFIGGNLGNIVTDAYVGGRVKIGWNITRDWAHSAIGPVARSSEPQTPGTFEAFLSLDGRASLVGYNVFIDAADQHQLNRRKAIADTGVGIGVRIADFMVTYRIATISKEYDEALSRHEFKALRFLYTIR